MMAAITAKQMVQSIMDILDDVVKEYPEDDREWAKASILNAFSAQMFCAPMASQGKGDKHD